MITIIIAMAHVVAAETLDHDMTSQEKRKTGVYKLSSKEKAALQQWIDTHYEKRDEPVSQDGEELRSVLQENLYNGSYLRLANGTVWNIDPKDTNISMGWISAVDIIVSKSDDPNYPYRLTNSLTGSTIRARKVDALPAPVRTQPEPSILRE